MGKKIGITYDLKTDWTLSKDDPIDMNAEHDSPATVDKIADALVSGGHTVKRIGNINTLLPHIDSLGVDIVFNIAEGFRGRNRESQVPVLLELKKIPFVGSDALTLGITLDKIAAKKFFIADGIATPKYFNAGLDDDLKALNTIGYPLIVKTRWEGTSKGLSNSSRVNNIEELKEQVELINTRYHQPALVEEFIRGTEYTVPVLGNGKNAKAMPVAQVAFDGRHQLGDEFFTFDRVTSSGISYGCPAQIDKKLYDQMQDMAVRAYLSVDCLDFGRVDFRVDDHGNPYVLEINPLPSLASKDVFNIFPRVIGTTYEEVINRIVDFALERYGMSEKKVSIPLSA